MVTLLYATVTSPHRTSIPRLRILFAVCMAIGCAEREPTVVDCFAFEPPAAERPRNVVVIVGDTIRRDVVPLHGGTAEMPNLERLAREGVAFSRAYSTAPWTKPAVASLFTSLLPSKHGVVTHLDQQGRGVGIATTDVLAPERQTLAEAFRAAGYATGAIVSNPWLVRPYGYEQGFDAYEDSLARWSSSASEVSLAASYWIASAPRDRPWFLYLHYLDPHLPYGPLERDEVLARADEIAADERPVNDEALAVIRDQSKLAGGGSALELGVEPRLRLLELAYQEGVERFDRGIGEVLEALDANDRLDDTAILVTSDHGESLYARGFGNHGTSLYDDEVAIPMVLRWPGLRPQPAVSSCVTSLVDVMPMLCRLAGIDCPDEIDGRDRFATSRTPELEPRNGEPAAVLEGLTRSPRHRGIVVGSHKLLWEPDRAQGDAAYRLFDLSEDAAELDDLSRERADVVQRLRPRLDALAAQGASRAPQRALPDAEVERLRKLGYGD